MQCTCGNFYSPVTGKSLQSRMDHLLFRPTAKLLLLLMQCISTTNLLSSSGNCLSKGQKHGHGDFNGAATRLATLPTIHFVTSTPDLYFLVLCRPLFLHCHL